MECERGVKMKPKRLERGFSSSAFLMKSVKVTHRREEKQRLAEETSQQIVQSSNPSARANVAAVQSAARVYFSRLEAKPD